MKIVCAIQGAFTHTFPCVYVYVCICIYVYMYTLCKYIYTNVHTGIRHRYPSM